MIRTKVKMRRTIDNPKQIWIKEYIDKRYGRSTQSAITYRYISLLYFKRPNAGFLLKHIPQKFLVKANSKSHSEKLYILAEWQYNKENEVIN